MALPLKATIRYQATDTHLLQGYGQEVKVNPLASEAKYAYVAAMQDIEKHVRFVEGGPLPPGPSTDGEVPIILSVVASEELHMYPNERYWYIGGDQFNPLKVTLKVVGIWEPTDPNNSEYWLYHPEVMYNTLFTSEQDLFANVMPGLNNDVHEYSWYMIFDHNADPLDERRPGQGRSPVHGDAGRHDDAEHEDRPRADRRARGVQPPAVLPADPALRPLGAAARGRALLHRHLDRDGRSSGRSPRSRSSRAAAPARCRSSSST